MKQFNTWLTKILCFVPAIFTFAAGAAAIAAEISSDYTKIQLQNCPQVVPAAEEGTFAGAWECPGYRDWPVYIAESDLRMFVSFGRTAPEEPAVSQTLPNFNTVNDTLEWRLRDGVPFATILRWFPSLDNGKNGSVLVVTQLLPGGGTCQIARIDAQANKNANVMARQAADTMAGTFDCTRPPVVQGNPGALY